MKVRDIEVWVYDVVGISELMVVHGTSKVDITIDEHLEAHEINVELVQAPPSAPLASLFRDAESLNVKISINLHLSFFFLILIS